MQLLTKSTYLQTHSIDADPVKHLESSTKEYLHMSFLLWEYKRAYSKKEYRELLADYHWDKGSAEEKRALKLAEHFQDFAYRPHALTQIPVTTLLRLCSEKYSPIIEELKQFDDEDITCECVHNLIKERAAQLKKEKESELPEKPSIWKRNCRGERYAQFPPVYEEDYQTGTLTQKLMDEYGLIPQDIVRRAIANLYQKIEDKEGQREGSAAPDVDKDKKQQEEAASYVDVRDTNSYREDHHNSNSSTNQTQTVEDKWAELNKDLKLETQKHGEISHETGKLIVENTRQWEATVPQDKKWDAIANIVGHDEALLKYLSKYAYGNHPEWRKSWGATLATYHNFKQELDWVGLMLRTDALIAMGYKIPAIVKINDGSFEGRQGKIIELRGDNDKPILVKFEDFSGYFHWSELEIVTLSETFESYTSVKDIQEEPVEFVTNAQETQEEEYLQEPEEPDAEYEATPLDKAIEALIYGTWTDIRNIFNEHPQIKGDAWKALSATQRKRVIYITPETNKLLNEAKKNGVIQEYKELATGVYHIKMPGALLWEQRAFHEIEIRHYGVNMLN